MADIGAVVAQLKAERAKLDKAIAVVLLENRAVVEAGNVSAFRCSKQRGIYALGGWSRSDDDAGSGSTGRGRRDLPRVRKVGRPRVSKSNPDRSETVFNEAPIAQVQSSGVRDTKVQE